MLIEPLKNHEINIEHIEKKYDLILPDDYKAFLTRFDGGISKDNTMIYVRGLSEGVEIDSLFGIAVEQEWLNIEYWTDLYFNDLPNKSLVIGYDMLRGMLIIVFSGSDKGLYYWDCTGSRPESTVESNAFFVCDSFAEFEELLGGFIIA